MWVTVFPKQFYMKVHLLPQNLSETRTQPNLNDPTVHGHISSPRLHSGRMLPFYRQARLRSFTCASLFVIMVAKTRPKRTLLMST